MKREVLIEGKKRLVELERRNENWSCRIDGQPVDADIVEIGAGVYSILLGGQVLEARVEPSGKQLQIHVGERRLAAEVIDPRQWRRRHGALEVEGSQEVLAPMPGKVVRLLAAAGDAVDAGQGILVLEAMKMQNEVRSPKSGKLERLLVTEGQPVNAGDTLAVVG
jgi:biotin carboxyl carrier protein